MKIVAIGDIHGSAAWKDIILAEPNADKVVFIGDYMDSFDFTPLECLNNLKDILNYKKENTEKIVLLTGNHDIHYLNIGETYSGYQHYIQPDVYEILHEAIKKDIIQAAWSYRDIIFTHAGLTNTWCTNTFGKYEMGIDGIVFAINEILKHVPKTLGFRGHDMYGNDITQGPLWVRPQSLHKDSLECTQVVGHTRQPQGVLIWDNLYFIDTLQYPKEYLVITDGDGVNKFEIKTL